jgi:uncharacterized protein involved in exopolysaccharide biosynthesis
MNLIQLFKLLRKNILLLLIVPVILGSLVWFLTRNEVLEYSSKTTVYTGLSSGLSMESLGKDRVDFFGSKIEFDNLLSIFKARETHKEIGLRLFAQGLTLKSWDPRYISRANYIRLHSSTPSRILDLVVKKDTMSLSSLMSKVPMVLTDTSGLSNKKVVLENKWYSVGAGETLFTVSKAFATPVSDIMNWNSLTTTTLETGQRIIVKQKERVVYQDIANQYDTIDLYVPDTTFFIKTEIDSVAFERTVERFRRYADNDDTNYIYRLLNKNHAHYSISSISGITAKRIQGSDLVEISYKNSDPGICMQSLNFMVYSFEKYYRNLKENQSDHIVAYFEQRVKESAALLLAAENRLLNFNQDNNIINYYEQTRHISDQKEQLDSRYYDEKMKFSSADSVIRILENKLKSMSGITEINTNILSLRNQLSEITYKIAINELNENKDPKAVTALQNLRVQADDIKKKIAGELDKVFKLRFSPEGASETDILTQWLDRTIQFEESKATLAALYERKKEFQKTYEIFAPLGATLTRIEREIDVYEQQYLGHLNSLNQAKLKQQNLEFKSNIKVVDAPFFPLRPEGSKRSLLIVASSIVGLVLTIFVILALEYLDQTLKFPKRAEKYTGLKLITGYPILFDKKTAINTEYVTKRSVQILVQNLRGVMQKLPTSLPGSPGKIVCFSTQRTDGKTLIQEEFANELRRIGHRVLSVNYNSLDFTPKFTHNPQESADYILYNIDDSFFNIPGFNELINLSGRNVDLSQYDYIILEIPSIVHHPYPPAVVKDADLGIMIVRANRTWQQADVNNLAGIMEFFKSKPVLVLNGVNPEFLQELVGELPKKRSRLRRILKKIMRLQFFERYQIKK